MIQSRGKTGGDNLKAQEGCGEREQLGMGAHPQVATIVISKSVQHRKELQSAKCKQAKASFASSTSIFWISQDCLQLDHQHTYVSSHSPKSRRKEWVEKMLRVMLGNFWHLHVSKSKQIGHPLCWPRSKTQPFSVVKGRHTCISTLNMMWHLVCFSFTSLWAPLEKWLSYLPLYP